MVSTLTVTSRSGLAAAFLAVTLAVWSLALSADAATEVFEIGPHNASELPKGKEADGIAGDFVLRNARVEALVSGNLPERRANMSVHYNNPTPGCLYDLSVRGSDNDQLTVLAPGDLAGPVSYVRVLEPAESVLRVSGVRVLRTAARGGGRAETHEYLLGDEWDFLAIVSTYRNAGDSNWDVRPEPRWKEFSGRETVRGILTGDATNPSDHQGYALGISSWTGDLALGEPAVPQVLKPGEERKYLAIVAPGRSPAEAFGRVYALRGEVGNVVLRLESDGAPATSPTVRIAMDAETSLAAYPDSTGTVELSLPPGTYSVTTSDVGRPAANVTLEVEAGSTAEATLELARRSAIAVKVTDDGARTIPSKVQFIGTDGTKNPYFGPQIQARGCFNIYMSETGLFSQPVDPGNYRLVITRGTEFSHAVVDVTVKPGETTSVSARLERIVDSSGWVSTDFHNHSTPSGDNYCGTDDRVINLAVEQVEFAPTTEHNRLYDWGPHIERLGLSGELRTVVGIELTGPNAHFNAFPMRASPLEQDGGAPVWKTDPRICAIVLRDFQDGGPFRWVQLNHPNVGQFFRDRNRDGVPDGGYPGLEYLIDAAEVWSLDILADKPTSSREVRGKTVEYPNRTFAWLQLLNQGMRMNCVAVSDAHAVYGNAVGGWRTYVKSSEDRPDRLDVEEIIRNSKAGRMFVTTGPFLQVRLTDGTEIGESTVLHGAFEIDVRVQCTDWLDINRVQVLVNSRPASALNFTRKSHPALFREGVVRFEHRIAVSLSEDAHLIVVAVGEGLDLRTGYGGSTPGRWHPSAFTNPIYVDIDGHGFEANRDTLGYPLPVGK